MMHIAAQKSDLNLFTLRIVLMLSLFFIKLSKNHVMIYDNSHYDIDYGSEHGMHKKV